MYGRGPRLRQAAILAASAVGLIGVGLGAQAWTTRDVIVPGVTVGGVDIGGLSKTDARARLANEIGARLSRPITVHTAVGDARVIPGQAGIGIDLDAATDRAYAAGRLEQRLLPYLWSASLDVPVTYAQPAALPLALAAIAHPPRDARLDLSKDGAATVTPATTGVSFDAIAAQHALAAAAVAGRTEITLAAVTVVPAVGTEEARAAADSARALLAAPIRLVFHGKPVGRIAPADLAPLLRAVVVGGAVAVGVESKGLRPLLAAAARRIERAPVDATWKTGKKRARVVAAKPGLKVDPVPTALAIAGATTTHVAGVAVLRTPARLTTEEAEAMGIKEALFKAPITTQMGGSSANRIWNVHLLAQILDRHIIKPGETFDFNKVVGERTTARGFKVGQQIENGQLVPAVGGGVCQVATTLFDSAFYAGFKITARRNHDFYISHYPMGMDATVSWGGPELRFVNTLRHAVLLRTSYTDSTLSMQLYGTREGITVTQSLGPISGGGGPQTKIVDDPTLPPGTEVREGGGGNGFSVTVFRVVKRNGKVIRKDSFRSDYTPQAIIVRRGPPKPKDKPATGTTPEPPALPPVQ